MLLSICCKSIEFKQFNIHFVGKQPFCDKLVTGFFEFNDCNFGPDAYTAREAQKTEAPVDVEEPAILTGNACPVGVTIFDRAPFYAESLNTELHTMCMAG